VDDVVRARRLLLIVTLAACSPAKREPVGVSNGGAPEHESQLDAASTAPPLTGLPPDFRTTWNRVGLHITSEHGRFAADVYEHDRAAWAEDLFLGDASAGVYLLTHEDGGIRFAVADDHGRTVEGSTDPCTRCHSGARDSVFDVHQ
jgi:hypothetical protein